jgi:hypothetical protein
MPYGTDNADVQFGDLLDVGGNVYYRTWDRLYQVGSSANPTYVGTLQQINATINAPTSQVSTGQSGAVDPVLAATIYSLAQQYGLDPVTILSAAYMYLGFTDPVLGTDKSIVGTVMLRDGRVVQAAEFFPSATNNVDLRLRNYAAMMPAPVAPLQPPSSTTTQTQSGTQQQTTQQTQQQTTSSQTSTQTASTIPATVQLVNLSRPSAGLAFQVGDRFAVRISGAPNSTVSDVATQNGSTSTTVHGQTDASGHFAVEATLGPEHIGNWTETWKVGSTTAAPVLSFSVAAAPASQQTTNQQTTTETDDSDLQLIGTTTPWSSWTQAITDALPESVQNVVQQIGAADWPWWTWAGIAGGLYGAYRMSNGRRRR